MKKYIVKVYESGTAMPHTAEFEIEVDTDDYNAILKAAVDAAHKLGYNADELGHPEKITEE